jgi:hypothetical protein
MRKSITQEFDYGCGIACFAFALHLTYKQAVAYLGPKQATNTRFWIRDFAVALSKHGKVYKARYVKPRLRRTIYQEGAIVLIRRSKHYPSGHYLIRHNNYWMDPWINLPYDKNINHAKSGFRRRLPGLPMYVLLPS